MLCLRHCLAVFSGMPLASNATRQALPKAEARKLGKDKAQCLAACFLILPVENRACSFDRTRLNTFGDSPWNIHEASVSISMAFTGRCIRA